jgi:hypothetical protein
MMDVIAVSRPDRNGHEATVKLLPKDGAKPASTTGNNDSGQKLENYILAHDNKRRLVLILIEALAS